MRIVVAEPGLGRVLRDAGHEVIYLGPDHSPEQIAATAIQEDADAIGLTVQDDADRISVLLAELDADDIAVFGGTVTELTDWASGHFESK